MRASSFKRTKIVATIGPASWAPKTMEELMSSGVNAFRLNFSHGTHEEHGNIIKTARHLGKKLERPIAVIADLQGPKIRVGALPKDGIAFVRGQTVRFAYGADYEKDGIIPIQHDVSPYVKKDERIFLRDGQILVEVTDVERKGVITAKVTGPGMLFSKQGMNLPDTDLGGEILTDKDIADLEFAVGAGVDYIALSFVQTPKDITNFKDRIKALGEKTPVIVKFETRMAVEHIDEIVDTADAIMVARGDLAVETEPESVPTVQRRLIELGQQLKKPVIVATQMLESMTQSPTPTRAEVSDIATAVYEGADAVMLSGETASGLFPVEAVRLMKRVIQYTEQHMEKPIPYRFGDPSQENAISAAAIILASQVGAKVIIAETTSGRTARNVSGFRPPLPIVMVTHVERVYDQLAIVWGGKSFYHHDPATASQEVIRRLKSTGSLQKGDIVVVTWGTQRGVTGGTDTLQARVVE